MPNLLLGASPLHPTLSPSRFYAFPRSSSYRSPYAKPPSPLPPRFEAAIEAYSRGLSHLLLAGDVPVIDFGLRARPPDQAALLLRSPSPEAKPLTGEPQKYGYGTTSIRWWVLRVGVWALFTHGNKCFGSHAWCAAVLLTNRAAAALKLGRRYRALADTAAATTFAPGAKSSFRRAQAFDPLVSLTIGRFDRIAHISSPDAHLYLKACLSMACPRNTAPT